MFLMVPRRDEERARGARCTLELVFLEEKEEGIMGMREGAEDGDFDSNLQGQGGTETDFVWRTKAVGGKSHPAQTTAQAKGPQRGHISSQGQSHCDTISVDA